MRNLELCPTCGNPVWHNESPEGTHSWTTLDGATYNIVAGRLYRDHMGDRKLIAIEEDKT